MCEKWMFVAPSIIENKALCDDTNDEKKQLYKKVNRTQQEHIYASRFFFTTNSFKIKVKAFLHLV